MDTLNALTKEYVRLSEIPASRDNSVINFHLEKGTALMFNLFSRKSVAVSNFFLSKDARMPYHVHADSVEVLMIHEGLIKCVSDVCEKTLGVGEIMRLEKNEGHFLHAKEDTWLIAITVPADEAMMK